MPEISQFKEHIRTVMKGLGMNEVGARMISELYISPEELSLDELADKTSYSLASISNTLKLIQNFPFVTRMKKPGSKKVYVGILRDRMEMMKIKLKIVDELEIQPAKKNMPQMISSFRKKAKTKKEKEQLEIMKKHYRQIKFMEEIQMAITKKIEEYEKIL